MMGTERAFLQHEPLPVLPLEKKKKKCRIKTLYTKLVIIVICGLILIQTMSKIQKKTKHKMNRFLNTKKLCSKKKKNKTVPILLSSTVRNI